MKIANVIIGLTFLTALTQSVNAQSVYELTLDVKQKGAPVQPTMYGLFFEDINFAADGGLYAELVKNRSFDFPQHLMGWKTFGKVEVLNQDAPFDRNPTYLKLSDAGHPHKHTGIENEGFRGIGFQKDKVYRFSIWAKNSRQDEKQMIRIHFINAKDNIIGEADLSIDSPEWKKYQLEIKATETDPKGLLRLFLELKGDLYIDHVSLFPKETWNNHENGLRVDLAQALADLKPGVFRFPGGCIVEGTDLATRYDWKKSIGPVENRPVNENRWHYTFTNRFFSDYYQSYGLGFYEYFLLSEEMGAEPLPVLNCGLSCQYQNEKEECHVALDHLDSYVQDALDLIEFANGTISSTWGKKRAEMGHPAPFHLKYLAIGNEQWGKEYTSRLPFFVKAIRAKYPEIQLIGSAGPLAEGEQFDYLWPEMKKMKVDLVDEHYYKGPDWFLKNAKRYDGYDRKGPAVFAGEYACHLPSRQNSFQSALYEAAFMTGLERNADIVHMCTYAPLLAHVDAWQWRPDLIWFDNLRVVKSPNYYVQQLYARNKGTNTASLLWNKQALAGQEGLYASAVYDKTENEYIIKVANTSGETKKIEITLAGLNEKSLPSVGECLQFKASHLDVINTLDHPDNVMPQKGTAEMDGKKIRILSEAESFSVFRIKL